jgi:hypothetical protein
MTTVAADYLADMTRELTALAERNGLWASAALLQMAYLDLSKAAHGITPAPPTAVRLVGSAKASGNVHLRMAK